MLRTEDIIATLRMFQEENLDVRTVTLGVNLLDCADPDVHRLCRKIAQKIQRTIFLSGSVKCPGLLTDEVAVPDFQIPHKFQESPVAAGGLLRI